MKLSTKSRYGVRALLDIAVNSKAGPVPLEDIAKRQEISRKYLEHLLRTMKIAGFVKSVRGPKGGYLLNKEAAKIDLFDIVSSLEGSIEIVECVTRPALCSRSGTCATRDIWDEINSKIAATLKGVSLKNLVDKQAVKNKSQEYVI